MRHYTIKSKELLAALRAHPAGYTTGAEIAGLMGWKPSLSCEVTRSMQALGLVKWVRDPGYKASHRTRLFAPEHAPEGAQVGPPGVKGVRVVKAAGAKKAVRLEQAAPVQGAIPKPEVCPAGTDQRFTVRELPKGYRSTLNPSECRPWAAAAAASVFDLGQQVA